MPEPIRYCVTVDTEEEWDWNSGYPTGPTRPENIRRLPEFQERMTAVGAAAVYFTNHAVLADPIGRAIIRELSTKPNVEIGLHIHPWNTPPLAPVDKVSARDSFLHNLPWDEQRAKLDSTLAAFAEAGLKPTSFRGGRYSTSPQIQDHLRAAGVWVDCSVLPFNTWADDGAPDYRTRGLAPVRKPPQQLGGQAVWELPLTYGYTRRNQAFWHRALTLADSRVGRGLRLTGILDRTGIVSKAWLNFENPLGERMLQFLAVLRRLRPPFVSFTLHSSSLLPGGSPYNRTAADVAKMLERAETVLNRLRDWPEFQPATMTEIATHLETTHR